MRLSSSGLLFACACLVDAAFASMLSIDREMSGKTQETISYDSLPGHTIRFHHTDERVCPGNKGIAGYVDIEKGDKHIAFWAFESRNDPVNDPVILWLTGGPGCSGIGIGMMVELGPCLVKTNSTARYNVHSWNNQATVIFVDQPANVGYSYSSNNVQSSAEATADMHAFLDAFFRSFPKLAQNDFYIAGESYGGSWVPLLAAQIQRRRTSPIARIARSTTGSAAASPQINLKGIMLGNAQVSQKKQWRGFYDTGCNPAEPLFNASTCVIMQEAATHCESLLESCSVADFDPVVCDPLLARCRKDTVFLVPEAGLNPYDVRLRCDDGPECYEIINTAEQYMNRKEVKRQFEADTSRNFTQCNPDIQRDFGRKGDVIRDTEKLVTYLLDENLNVLVYVGNKDWYCNAAGVRYWVNDLPWHGMAPFRAAKEQPWMATTKNGTTTYQAGSWKHFDRLTFVEVFDAGHMVPMDKSAEAVYLINSWIISLTRS